MVTGALHAEPLKSVVHLDIYVFLNLVCYVNNFGEEQLLVMSSHAHLKPSQNLARGLVCPLQRGSRDWVFSQ